MPSQSAVVVVAAAATYGALRHGGLLRARLQHSPALLYRLLDIAFSPREVLRKLVLVGALQLIATALKRASALRLGGKPRREPLNYSEFEAANREAAAATGVPVPFDLQLYCSRLGGQADEYLRLMASDDMHGLMFHLRSELMRSQVRAARAHPLARTP